MELIYLLSSGGEPTLPIVTGWAAVSLFILVTLIAAWRMISYTNLSEKSPYLVGLEHHEEPDAEDIHDADSDQEPLPEQA
jgi:hypothetical protein